MIRRHRPRIRWGGTELSSPAGRGNLSLPIHIFLFGPHFEDPQGHVWHQVSRLFPRATSRPLECPAWSESLPAWYLRPPQLISASVWPTVPSSSWRENQGQPGPRDQCPNAEAHIGSMLVALSHIHGHISAPTGLHVGFLMPPSSFPLICKEIHASLFPRADCSCRGMMVSEQAIRHGYGWDNC